MNKLSARHGFSALLLGAAWLVACAGSNPPDAGPKAPTVATDAPVAPTAPTAEATAAPTALPTPDPVATQAPTAEPAATPVASASAAATAAVASGPPGANLHVGSMSVDGLTLEDLACHADGLGLLGSMIVVGSISKKKTALNACGKGKPRVEWTAAKGSIGTITVKAENAKMEACVAKALKGTPAPFEGECAATLVLGK